ncbi:DNA-binding MarR family transcriptional regulator [Oceanotoga teriensis]|uniref:DNA-binding MarR family transcriptional regulator n=2 Tax=Oceanotoga teriensis TaxID=515440 RepID=A0AA45C701_9BACT|nr:DNA-binding MarR family transcriptional regulator [Oceanotoga teriensis]
MRKKIFETMSLFMKLVENAANGKKKILDFGDDMKFYRGEIHLIKVIGENPGMYISQVARYLKVTRAVVSKTLLKLEKDGFIIKEEDEENKKKLRLFLTKKGNLAYVNHQKYHLENDKEVYDYLNELDDDQIKIIEQFLKKAGKMLENHY